MTSLSHFYLSSSIVKFSLSFDEYLPSHISYTWNSKRIPSSKRKKNSYINICINTLWIKIFLLKTTQPIWHEQFNVTWLISAHLRLEIEIVFLFSSILVKVCQGFFNQPISQSLRKTFGSGNYGSVMATNFFKAWFGYLIG